jgi:hypothetical protein
MNPAIHHRDLEIDDEFRSVSRIGTQKLPALQPVQISQGDNMLPQKEVVHKDVDKSRQKVV